MKKLVVAVAVGLTAVLARGEAVRYVATNGNDTENDGLSEQAPFATIAKAVDDLGETGGRVFVAKGTYAYNAADPMVVISTPVEVVGATGDPKDVVIDRASGRTGRHFKLNNANAALRFLTLQRGATTNVDEDNSSGGNVWITSNGGTVENCIIQNGSTANCWGAGGGNVFMRGGRLSRCKLIGGVNNTDKQNEWVYSGGSLVALGGVIENCMITGCTSGSAPVGLYYAPKMVNCTIVGNGSGVAGALIVGASGGTGSLPSIVNCAFFNNGTKDVVKPSVLNKNVTTADYAKTALSACASEQTINDNCLVVSDPGFVDAASGDYRLTASSDLVDQGSAYSQTAATSAFDLAGEDRVSEEAVDIGAYEYCSAENVRVASVTAAVEGGRAVCRVTLASDSIPAEATVSVYRDGQVVDVRRGVLKKNETFVVSKATPGAYAFRVVVKGEAGNVRKRWASVYLAGGADVVRFVSPFGSDEAEGTAADPYKTVVKAVTELGETGGKIYLEPGLYTEAGNAVDSKTNAVLLTTPVQIVGLSGNPQDTVLTRASTCARVVKISHADAAIRCVTIKDGLMFGTIKGADGKNKDDQCHGGNVWIEAKGGTLENCIVRDGTTENWAAAGANVFMKGGRLVGCTLIGGTVRPTDYVTGSYIWCYNGASLYAEGGVIENCIVRDCTSGSGPVGLKGAKMYNSTVINNTGIMCGGIEVAGNGNTAVANCAIFGGKTTYAGESAAATDVAFRSFTRSGDSTATPAAKFATCAAEVAINDTCLVTADPKFGDPDNGDFTPQADSVLVNAGKAGLTTAAYDVYGGERVFGASGIDIGAAECLSVLSPRLGEHDVTVADGKVCVDVSLLKTSAIVDMKLRIYRDGVVLEEKPMGVAYETSLHLEYDEPGYYAVKYMAYGAEDAVYEGTIGDGYLAGDETNVRIVTPTGPMTLQEAIYDLGTAGGKVYVDPGTYAGVTANNSFVISNAVTVIGRATDPKQVKLVKTPSANARVLRLNHTQAAIRNVWISGGYVYSENKTAPAGDSGGNVFITSNGGTVENCVITDGITLVYDGGGGNIYMTGGRVANCLIEGGYACEKGDTTWSNCGGSVCIHGGVMENCLIRKAVGRTGDNDRYGGAPIVVYDKAKLLNCTVADCVGWVAGAILVRRNGKVIPSVINCTFYNNQALASGAADYQVVYKESTHKSNTKTTTPEEARSAFDHCAATHKINDSCLAPADFGFVDAANGDYTLTAGSPLVNAGADYAAAGGVAAYDLAGGTRVVKTVDIGAYEYPKVKLTPKSRALLLIIR